MLLESAFHWLSYLKFSFKLVTFSKSYARKLECFFLNTVYVHECTTPNRRVWRIQRHATSRALHGPKFYGPARSVPINNLNSLFLSQNLNTPLRERYWPNSIRSILLKTCYRHVYRLFRKHVLSKRSRQTCLKHVSDLSLTCL